MGLPQFVSVILLEATKICGPETAFRDDELVAAPKVTAPYPSLKEDSVGRQREPLWSAQRLAVV